MAKQEGLNNPKTFLSTPGAGREMISFRKGQVIFAQGDASDAVFVIQTGSVGLGARSQEAGKPRSTSWVVTTLWAKTRLPVSVSASYRPGP